MPRIWVWTAPVAPIVQRSELVPALNWGAIAEGGGDLTVVVCEPFVVTVLVDSVTMGSPKAASDSTTIRPPHNREAENSTIRAPQVT